MSPVAQGEVGDGAVARSTTRRAKPYPSAMRVTSMLVCSLGLVIGCPPSSPDEGSLS